MYIKMIKKFKRKFIIMSMSAVLVLLITIVSGINIMSFADIEREADETLEFLPIESDLSMPKDPPPDKPDNKGEPKDDKDNKGDRKSPSGDKKEKKDPSAPDNIFDQRYFTVKLDQNNEIEYIDLYSIGSVNEEEAKCYVNTALKKDADHDFIGRFRYKKVAFDDGIQITFLDCGKEFDSFRVFLSSGILMATLGFVTVAIVINLFAEKFAQPLSITYQKQKQFITDAGHELKTPLTVINANLDLIEDEVQDKEAIGEIRQQSKRLEELTNDLVYLARIEESPEKMPVLDFPISELVSDVAGSYNAIVASKNKELVCDITQNLSAVGNQNAIKQLLFLLLDNAVKYSPSGDKIALTLKKAGKGCLLTVANTSATPIDEDNIDQLFDRFYRGDASRNSETGGYGIGLSTAKAIVEAHNGKITLTADQNNRFTVTVVI